MARKNKIAVAAPAPAPQQGLAKVKEAAAFLNTSIFTIYRLINADKLQWAWVGGQKRIKWESLHSYIA
ncbi:MAG: excisionase family DNA-binding protein [Planctomycetes bacterium]|nr:excisionase family DNA-binding protein [Planctomycetota bacterium]